MEERLTVHAAVHPVGEHLDRLAMPPTRSDLDVLARHLDVVPATTNVHSIAR